MKILIRTQYYLASLISTKTVLVVFSVAFGVRIAFICLFHPYRDLARYEVERVAISLATTGVYGNPYSMPTGPTAHVSPGYTLILAVLFRMFGTGVPAEIVKELLASAVSALSCALLPMVAKALFLDWRAGLLAGFLAAVYPERPLVQVDGDWETPYIALALMLLSSLLTKLWTQKQLTPRKALWHGLAWGIALQFVSALLPMFFLFVLVGGYVCRRVGFWRYISFGAIEVLTVVVCLAPWAIRNNHALGSPILTRSNFGTELRISNNDFADPDQRINSLHGIYAKYHPLQNSREALKVRSMGEVRYNHQALQAATLWVRHHPSRFLHLTFGRARCFWLYHDPSLLKTWFVTLTVLLGFAGLVFVFRDRRITGIVIGLILLTYPVPNYLIHVGSRQEYPIQWIMTLLTACLIVRSAQAVRLLARKPPESGTACRFAKFFGANV